MTTNNWREEFEEKFSSKLDFQKICTQEISPTYPVVHTFEISDFIETQIAQARSEWYEYWYNKWWLEAKEDDVMWEI